MVISRLGKRFKRQVKLPILSAIFSWGWKVLLLVLVIDTVYLVGFWPDWKTYAGGPVQQSRFIHHYISQQHQHRDWPPLRWSPVSINSIPRHMLRALVVAEDARFYYHSGIDTDALQEAMENNLSEQRIAYGGSTISQQTVKNMFLTPSRNPLRKWHELLLTMGMERNLNKKRILTLYANIVEFGRGIYGVNAAALYYWGIPASELSELQAIELAATLPSPVKHNPATRTKSFLRRVNKIQQYFSGDGDD
jgi:monofunctional biosynthetic peptidoglycan transglycosylase